MTTQSKRPFLCRLGLHTPDRSQGLVGYCLRPGCDDLKRIWQGHYIWICYVQPPTGHPPRGKP